MTQIVFEIRESPEGGFEGSALGHRIYTQGDDWEQLKIMTRDAVRCHFSEENRPVVMRLFFTREEVLSA